MVTTDGAEVLDEPPHDHVTPDYDAAVDVYGRLLDRDDEVLRIAWGDGETTVWVRSQGVGLRSRTDPGGGVGPESVLTLSTLAGYLATAEDYHFTPASELPPTPKERGIEP